MVVVPDPILRGIWIFVAALGGQVEEIARKTNDPRQRGDGGQLFRSKRARNSLGKTAKLSDTTRMRALLPFAVLGFSCLVSSVSAQSPTSRSPVVADILKLSNAKVDEGVIVTYVQSAPRANVSAADLLELHSNGISSRVLVALLNPRPAEPAQVAAPTEVHQPVSDQAQPAPQSVAAPAQTGDSSISSPPVVEAPLVDYVSAPVYVGVGSIYYPNYGWWGVGWGWGYLGWGGCFPWYGYGWYPYWGYSGYYAYCGYHHHGHGHSGGQPQNGGGGHPWSVAGSSVAGSGGNPNGGLAASPASRSVSGAASIKPQLPANRAGTSTGNLSSGGTGNTLAGVAASPGGKTVLRSSTYAANAQTTTPGMGQNGGARPAIKPSGGAISPVASGTGQQPSIMTGSSFASPARSAPSSISPAGTVTPGARPGIKPAGGVNRPVATGQQPSTLAGRSFASPTRPAPSSFSPAGTVAPRYAGSPTIYSGYPGGGPRASGSYASAGFGGRYSTARSFSAPSMMGGNYSAGRSSGSYMGGYSGGSRGFSVGSGGFGARGGGGGGGHGGGGYGGGGGRR